jgi:hypothetical protein
MPSVDPTRDFLRTPLVCMTRPRLIRELCDSDLNVRFATRLDNRNNFLSHT